VHVPADSWYSSATFQWATGILSAAIIAAICALVGFRAVNPRRELVYEVLALVPFLTPTTADARDGVEIRLSGEILDNPQVLEIRLTNHGRLDIATDAFDQSESSPANFKLPRIKIDGTGLNIGPDLLKRRQSIAISVLVDGASPSVTIPDSPLLDVDIREQQKINPPSTALLPLTAVVGACSACLTAVAWAARLQGPEALGVGLILASGVIALIAWKAQPRK